MEPHPYSIVDEVGTVYLGDECVYRAISRGMEPQTLKLLQCGLMEKLYAENLFPRTAVSEKSFPDASLVLEHERITPTIYPYEWSPEMLRGAARCVLKVNAIANEFGYEIKDAHPYNVMFNRTSPNFVDFGSIATKHPGPYWSAYDEFLRSYLYPLKLYRKGFYELYAHLHLLHGCSLPRAEFLMMSSSLFRVMGRRFTDLYWECSNHYKNPLPKHADGIDRRLKRGLPLRLAKRLYFNYHLPFRGVSLKRLEKSVNRIGLDSGSGPHPGHGALDSSGIVGKRRKRVLEILEKLHPVSVIELAGTGDILSPDLAGVPGLRHVYCVCHDPRTLDSQMRFEKTSDRISPMVFDIMGNAGENGIQLRAERLKCDLVLALGVSGSFPPSQPYHPGIVMDRITSFSRKHVLIDFRPGTSDSRPHSAWNDEDEFERALSRNCRIISREKLEPNQTLYLAEIV